MTRNRYTLTPSVQDTKRKAGRTKSNGIRINTQQAESKKTVPFPKKGSTAIQNNNKKITRTYMQRYTMTEIMNHNRSSALERSFVLHIYFTWPKSSPLIIPWFTQLYSPTSHYPPTPLHTRAQTVIGRGVYFFTLSVRPSFRDTDTSFFVFFFMHIMLNTSILQNIFIFLHKW